MDNLTQLHRDEFAHYINTTPSGSNETWTLEGIGVESLSMAFNPQVSQYKQIIDRNANADFDGYQIQSSVGDKRIYKGDAMYEFLDEARRKAKSIETQLLEIDLPYSTTEGGATSYQATKYNILIVINEFLGENATISYDLYVKGSPVQGTAVITNKVPVFTETA